MSVFQVFVHADTPSDPYESRFVEDQLVEDRFSWFAALLPPVWGLVHGLWLEVIFWVLGVVVLIGISFGVGDEAAFWLYVLFAVLIGFEAALMRAAGLRRRGYVPKGDIIAPSADVAEMLLFKSRATR